MEATKRGVAAVTVCSTAFVTLGRAQAAALGVAGLPIAIVPHPFGLRKREEIRAIAETCVDDIARLLAGADAGTNESGMQHADRER